MSETLLVNPWSDPRTDPVKPDCFMCGKKIARRASLRGVELKDTLDSPYGPRLYAHEACLLGRIVGEIESHYRAALLDIADQKAKHGPW